MTILKSTRMVGPLSGVSVPATSVTPPVRHGERSCVCVCVHMCTRVRERAREAKRKRMSERERARHLCARHQSDLLVGMVNTPVCLCVSVNE